MKFNKLIGLKYSNDKSISKRLSVRMVARRDDKYLMISTKRGDLIFPGGGVEYGETLEIAGTRELKEETGFQVEGFIEYMGKIITRRLDRFDGLCLFESEMYFYDCKVKIQSKEISLSEREKELDVKPIWLTKEEIIKSNNEYINKIGNSDVWVETVEFILNQF